MVRDVELRSPFLLRSVDPPLSELVGQPIRGFCRLGKRIVWCFDDEKFLILHLMIAGRLHWKPQGAKVPGKVGLAAFHFDTWTLTLTEASSKKRASLHTARGEAALARHDPGGLDVLTADLAAFTAVLASENHSLKRAPTDPQLFDRIGNAFSDEILHTTHLSPLALTRALKPDAVARLFEAARATLTDWTDRLRAEVGDGFPEKVTAFRAGMAVHGRFGKPCPACGAEVQHLRPAENETNYCPGCQTGGRLLADRALSRLLKDDWPRTQEELEELRRGPGA